MEIEHSQVHQGNQLMMLNLTDSLKIKIIQIITPIFVILEAQMINQNGQLLKISQNYSSIILNKAYQLTQEQQIFPNYQYQKEQQTFSLNIKIKGFNYQIIKEQIFQHCIKKSKHLLCSMHFFGVLNNKYDLKFLNITNLFKKNVSQILNNKAQKNNWNKSIQKAQAIPEKFNLHQIKVIKEKLTQELNGGLSAGGYSKVSSLNVQFILQQTGQYTSKQLVCKKIIDEALNSNLEQQFSMRLSNEIQIVKKIKHSNQYFPHYYFDSQTLENQIYIDRYKVIMDDFIKMENNSIEVILHLAQQVVKAIIGLHQNNIVHRDIKSSNFLIDIKNSSVKVIDFGESAVVGQPRNQNRSYGSTLPLSPPQCAIKSIQQDYNGFNSPSIDYWSVAMLLYEIMFKKSPLSYSKPFISDIVNGWKNQFLLRLAIRQRNGVQVIQDIFNLICIKTLRLKQNDRMGLQTTLKLLQETQQYIKSLIRA